MPTTGILSKREGAIKRSKKNDEMFAVCTVFFSGVVDLSSTSWLKGAERTEEVRLQIREKKKRLVDTYRSTSAGWTPARSLRKEPLMGSALK